MRRRRPLINRRSKSCLHLHANPPCPCNCPRPRPQCRYVSASLLMMHGVSCVECFAARQPSARIVMRLRSTRFETGLFQMPSVIVPVVDDDAVMFPHLLGAPMESTATVAAVSASRSTTPSTGCVLCVLGIRRMIAKFVVHFQFHACTLTHVLLVNVRFDQTTGAICRLS